ncbi:MAG: GNAT family N-acetyltransferase [Ktedonobacterales bacterium]
MSDEIRSADQQGSEARIEIVQATVDDGPAIAPLFDAYRQFYHQPTDVTSAQSYLAERLTQGESVIFLARLRPTTDGGAASVVGFVQLYPIFSSIALRRAWLLNDLFVALEARRLGVGRALMQRARDFGVETNSAEMLLQTGVENTNAQALYSSLGWMRDDEYLTYMLTF